MTPDQIQSQINILQAELNKLKQLPDGMIGNSSDSPYVESNNHYIPQPGEVVEVSFNEKEWNKRIFLEYQKDDNEPYFCVTNSHFDSVISAYRNGEKYDIINFSFCRRLNGEIIEFGCDKPKDYTHLLPTGYEFCTEEEAEKLVKIKLINIHSEAPIGNVCNFPNNIVERHKSFYRPIRPIQFHVAVHEATTIEPNPYAVDWANAPEWADVHAYDKNEIGMFYGIQQRDNQHMPKWECSPFTLPTGLDWKQSKTVRPR